MPKINNRVHEDHRACLRLCPCICCGRLPTEFSPTEAAHCRLPYFGDLTVPLDERGGMGIKPHDKWMNPLNRECHSRQGKDERRFWEETGINPLESGASLWRNTGNLDACTGIVQRARMGATL